MHGNTVHSSAPNTSELRRAALTLRYIPVSTRVTNQARSTSYLWMAAGEPDPALLPAGCVGFWPLDGGGQDLAAGNNAQPDSEEWVKGLFGLAFRFDGDDSLRVSRCNKAMDPNGPPTGGDGAWNLDLTRTTMIAWVRPQSYAVAYEADRGIIMNKESSYEFGLADNTGALQGAFSPCWRWWGSVLIPLHEWTHVAVAYDGTNEAHFIGSEQVEATTAAAAEELSASISPHPITPRDPISRSATPSLRYFRGRARG